MTDCKLLTDRQTDRYFLPVKTREIWAFLIRQINSFYGISDQEQVYLDRNFVEATERAMGCFSHIKNKYYQCGYVNPLHTGQYFAFLYYLANTIYRNEIKGKDEEAREICDKLYCLNKLVSCCDVYYEVSLPDYFYVEHPVGSVVGRAEIGNGFSIMQGCTVGGNRAKYPILGKNVSLYSNAKILGDCHIGDNVLIGANCYIKDMDIPSGCMVFGQYPHNVIKENRGEKIKLMFAENFRE